MSGRGRQRPLGPNAFGYSGRGRPRTKELPATIMDDRPFPPGIVLGDPIPGTEQFRNRLPRVGSQFQLVVPGVDKNKDEPYSSTRPLPDKVCQEHPHLTMDEWQEYEEQVHKQPAAADHDWPYVPPSKSISATPTTTTATTSPCSNNSSSDNDEDDDGATDRPFNHSADAHHHQLWQTQRGGLLVCPAAAVDNNNKGEFWSFVQPLLLPGANVSASTPSFVNSNNNSIPNGNSPLLAVDADTTQNSSSNGSDNVVIETPWEHQILEWHQQLEHRRQQIQQEVEEQQQNLPKKRGRKPKRKVPDVSTTMVSENVFDWYTSQIMSNTSTSNSIEGSPLPKKQRRDDDNNIENTTTITSRGNHEEEAQVIQHLWLQHEGQTPAATLETMVQLSAGKAAMAQKVRRRELKRQPPCLHSTAPWRLLLRRSILAPMGDFRDTIYSTKAKYPYPMQMTTTATTTTFAHVSTKVERNIHKDNRGKNDNDTTALGGGDDNNMDDRFSCISDQDDPEFVKAIWKAVLAFGKAMEEQLASNATSSGSNRQPPRLSVLLSFLQNASEVRPMPEDVFRAPSIPPEINNCLNNIMEHVDKARQVQAGLLDLLAATNDEGVDFEALSKFMDQSSKTLAVQLDDSEEVYRQIGFAADWQQRLDALVAEPELTLRSLEKLAQEARSHSFRSNGLVHLEDRIQKAYQLRDRIVAWQELSKEGDKESVKFVSAIVRDANRLKLIIPEVSELLQTHRSIEAWIDRANIAIRSRISLTEVRDLIKRGRQMPVDLSDFVDKLESRVCLADEWLDRLKEVVPCQPLPTGTCDESSDSDVMLQWMRSMRKAVKNGEYNNLHDMASEGSRIPVDVDCVKLLQVELDAKNWTAKAKRWIPNLPGDDDTSTVGRKGKVEDINEHLEKATALRDKLALPEEAKKAWVLDGEKELQDIVDAAEEWYEKYKTYLDWDNRRSDARSCLSIQKLQRIVDEGDAIFANLGSYTAKMQRILAQAESWLASYKPLLVRCRIMPKGENDEFEEPTFVTIPEMTTAVEAAAADISLDLDEAVELKNVIQRVKDWGNRALMAAPKRSKRQGRTRKMRFSVDDIIAMIQEASDLPVDTVEDVTRLQMQLSDVQEWRAKARLDIANIVSGFRMLREVVDELYGKPCDFSRRQGGRQGNSSSNGSSEEPNAEPDLKEEKKMPEELSVCDETSSVSESEQDNGDLSYLGNGGCNVNQLIKLYKREAASTGVVSGEAEVADILEAVSRWCLRSLKYLDTQRDVFDKRFFGAFDRFITEGRELLSTARDEHGKQYLDDKELGDSLNSACGDVVADQLERLDILLVDRARFVEWCDTAEVALFSKDRQPTWEKIKEVAEESKDFPSVCDVVQKVRGLCNKATEWVEAATELMNSDERMSQMDAKCIITEGEKLGFVCNELKTLRNELKASRSWANRVKKCKVDQGAAHVNDVQKLIHEHDKLLIEMADELEELKSAMKTYCICRRPYAGFMIGCDECEEWYHGQCIGITESRADRVDKFVCVRCCVTRAFKTSAANTAGIIKKWTSPKDLKKARQVDAQKHQRKVRKETKEIEKLQGKIQAAESGSVNEEKTPGVAETVDGTSGAASETPCVDNESTAVPVAPATTPEHAEQLAVGIQSAPAPDSQVEKMSDAEVQAIREKATASIQQCHERLSVLREKADERKRIQKVEDSNSKLLRYWCLRIRSLLFPESVDISEMARPANDGSLSPPMLCLVEEAKKLGILQLADVDGAINALQCMSWALRATSVLARKPSLAELESLISQASSLALPDEKALRMMKSMAQRASLWQGKVLQALEPIPGETKDFDTEALKQLAEDDIPIHVPEETTLRLAIEDKGARHCLCGGPSGSGFMLSCDKCELWFHGPCVNMTKESLRGDASNKWMCPPCSHSQTTPTPAVTDATMEEADSCKPAVEDVEMVEAADDSTDQHPAKPIEDIPMKDAGIHQQDHSHYRHDVSPEAPDPRKMWPPYGLMGTEKAQEALGEECCKISDPGEVHFDVGISPAMHQPLETSGDNKVSNAIHTSLNPVGSAMRSTTSVLGAVIAPPEQPLQSTKCDLESETTKPASTAIFHEPIRSDEGQSNTSNRSQTVNVKPLSIAPVRHTPPGSEEKLKVGNSTPRSPHGFVWTHDTSATSEEVVEPMDFSYTAPNGVTSRFHQERKPAVPFLLNGPLSSPMVASRLLYQEGQEETKSTVAVREENEDLIVPVVKDSTETASPEEQPSLVAAAAVVPSKSETTAKESLEEQQPSLTSDGLATTSEATAQVLPQVDEQQSLLVPAGGVPTTSEALAQEPLQMEEPVEQQSLFVSAGLASTSEANLQELLQGEDDGGPEQQPLVMPAAEVDTTSEATAQELSQDEKEEVEQQSSPVPARKVATTTAEEPLQEEEGEEAEQQVSPVPTAADEVATLSETTAQERPEEEEEAQQQVLPVLAATAELATTSKSTVEEPAQEEAELQPSHVSAAAAGVATSEARAQEQYQEDEDEGEEETGAVEVSEAPSSPDTQLNPSTQVPQMMLDVLVQDSGR